MLLGGHELLQEVLLTAESYIGKWHNFTNRIFTSDTSDNNQLLRSLFFPHCMSCQTKEWRRGSFLHLYVYCIYVLNHVMHSMCVFLRDWFLLTYHDFCWALLILLLWLSISKCSKTKLRNKNWSMWVSSWPK